MSVRAFRELDKRYARAVSTKKQFVERKSVYKWRARGNGLSTLGAPVTDRETGSDGGLRMGVRGPNNMLRGAIPSSRPTCDQS